MVIANLKAFSFGINNYKIHYEKLFAAENYLYGDFSKAQLSMDMASDSNATD